MVARRAWLTDVAAEVTVGEAAWMAASDPQARRKLGALRREAARRQWHWPRLRPPDGRSALAVQRLGDGGMPANGSLRMPSHGSTISSNAKTWSRCWSIPWR
ncbi:hypothetical protein G6F60_014588 [Rhizopus arrhizus]|nr:hypothetical protein G6F60_014588 [Rhizopus arrhizus]